MASMAEITSEKSQLNSFSFTFKELNDMIKTRKELRDCLNYEKKYYVKERKRHILDLLTLEPKMKIWKYQKLLRRTEYYYNKKSKSIFYGILYIFFRRKKNRLGTKLGFEIWENTFDRGLCIFHSGYIVINGRTRVGKNCRLVGNNCIGFKNNGAEIKNTGAPTIGENVEFGFGSCAFGEIVIEDNCIIGANAVVIKDVKSKSIIGGVPAKLIKTL